MMTDIPVHTLIYEYRITSAEMRSLDQNQRLVVLLKSESGKTTLRGEIPGCGEECDANLSEVILEYIMSCEGCGEQVILDQYLESFCTKLSGAIAGETRDAGSDAQILASLTCILSSMGGEFTTQRSPSGDLYSFQRCPICQASLRMGIRRGLKKAHETFFKLCDQTIQAISTDKSISPIDEGFDPGHSLTFKLT